MFRFPEDEYHYYFLLSKYFTIFPTFPLKQRGGLVNWYLNGSFPDQVVEGPGQWSGLEPGQLETGASWIEEFGLGP